MKFSNKISALGILTLIICSFIVGHLTPSLATRTHILMKGYPIEATGKAIPDYAVSKKGFLYFARGYDSANTP